MPIVIPANMTGTPKSKSALVDRRSNSFLIPGLGVEPGSYGNLRSWSDQELTRERVRLWYVATTRAVTYSFCLGISLSSPIIVGLGSSISNLRLYRKFSETDDTSNCPALCYSCNAIKRDRDDNDFMALDYKKRILDCSFCALTPGTGPLPKMSYALLSVTVIQFQIYTR